MHYVYFLESVGSPGQRYIGLTDDLKARLAAHNAGHSPHTSKFKPWRLVACIAFDSRTKAADSEQYLKARSGHAFALKRFW